MAASIWDTYPQSYRSREVYQILAAVKAGECAAVIGLSGSGKSNLVGFLAHRVHEGVQFVLVDCNRLRSGEPSDFLRLIRQSLDDHEPAVDELFALERALNQRLATAPGGLCILLDRFDALPKSAYPAVTSNLRSLRDAFKYCLTYVTAARKPISGDTELNELFFGNTIWLGPLSEDDALWSAGQYAQRRGVEWDADFAERLVSISWGYPSLLRAVCEVAADGGALEPDVLHIHPAVQRRVREFWAESPSSDDVRSSRLEGHPLLAAAQVEEPFDASILTASEHRLYTYFLEHPEEVCTKDELIQAVWSEETLVEGLRDDSLAQLVRRLRSKLEPKPSRPRHIHTAPGRGYLFSPDGKEAV